MNTDKPVAWQRRQLYPTTPGAEGAWEQCSADEATGHFERRPGYEYRPLYTRPTPTEVEALVSALHSAVSFVEALADNDPDEPIADNGMTVLGKLQFDAPALIFKMRGALQMNENDHG